jgi:hypothetical protein
MKYKLSIMNSKGAIVAVNTFSSERVYRFAELISSNFQTKIERL